MATVRAIFEQVRALAAPERATRVVDIGANPIDGDPPYKPMLEAGLCELVGFEPQETALSILNAQRGPHETYLPYAVGDGGEHELRVCASSGMTSLFEPEPKTLDVFHGFPQWGRVLDRQRMATKRLDDIDEVPALDFLKIDVQGSELAVFQGGRDKLGQAVTVQAEVSFLNLYRDQPLLWEIDRELREQGFVPHAFAAINRRAIQPVVVNNDPYKGINQLLEADMVYVRDFREPDAMSDVQLKHLALIAHCCYGSFDLAHHCLAALGARGGLPADAGKRYLTILST